MRELLVRTARKKDDNEPEMNLVTYIEKESSFW